MTTKKYIVQGCPCCHKTGSCAGITASFNCEDCTDCNIKKISQIIQNCINLIENDCYSNAATAKEIYYQLNTTGNLSELKSVDITRRMIYEVLKELSTAIKLLEIREAGNDR